MGPWAFIVITLIFCCSVHAANRYWIDIPDSFQKNMMALDTNQSGSYIEPWHPRMKFEMKIQIPHFKRNLRKQQLTLTSSFLQMSQSDYFMDKNLFCSCKFIIPEKPSAEDESIETAAGQQIEQQPQKTQQQTEQQIQQQTQQQVTQQQTSVDQSDLSIENMTPEQLQMLQQSIIRKKQQGKVKNSQIFIQQNQNQQQQYYNQESVQSQTYQQPIQQQFYPQPQQQQQQQQQQLPEQPNAQVLIGILEQQKQVIDLIENMYVHPQLQQQQVPVYSHTPQQQGQYIQENQQLQYQQQNAQQQNYQVPQQQQQQQQIVTNQQQQQKFIQQQPQVVQQQPIQQQQQVQVLLQKPAQQQQQPQYQLQQEQWQQQSYQQEQVQQQQQQQQQNSSYFSPAYTQLPNINYIPNVSSQQSYKEQPQVQSYQFDPKIFQQQKEVYGLNY